MDNKLLTQNVLRLDIPEMVINKLNQNSITKIGELCHNILSMDREITFMR